MNDTVTLDKAVKSAVAKLAAKIRRQGFDKSYVSDGSVLIYCSQCDAMVINGVATHETCCPNARKPQ